MSVSKKAILIFPHQIFEKCPLLNDIKPEQAQVYILEEFLFFKQYNFHKQKIILHRASMKFYYEYLSSKGYSVTYIESSKLSTNQSLNTFFEKNKFQEIFYTDTTDDWLEKKIKKVCISKKIKCSVYETPMFITSKKDLEQYKTGIKRPYFMKNFYIWQRKRLKILIDEYSEPEGGRWSFDTENRKKIPKDINVPSQIHITKNKFVEEAIQYVEKNFKNNIGSSENFNYAIDFKSVKQCVDIFIKEKLELFGPYEDAIDQRSHTLFHSILSPYLNIGLIQPLELVNTVVKYAGTHKNIPIESLEGYIRQIIGWREYMRLVYQDLGSKIRNQNYFNAKNKIPESFWSADTTIEPVDHTIKILKDYAYCHHIPRLMILGNFMNLCGFHPDEVYKWFMEMFIDAYDWVMVPNIYSMALYADGGLITTKPYISSSNYIRKMSDYKNNSDWNIKWDALYWNFIDTHFEKLQKENRLGFVAVQYLKIDKDKLKKYKQTAQKTLSDILKNEY